MTSCWVTERQTLSRELLWEVKLGDLENISE